MTALTFVGITGCALSVVLLAYVTYSTIRSRRVKYVPFSEGTPTNDFQVFHETFNFPVRASLMSFTAERGGLNFPPGPVKLTFDWDWPRPPTVSSPALKHVAYGNWSNEEWRLFVKAWRER